MPKGKWDRRPPKAPEPPGPAKKSPAKSAKAKAKSPKGAKAKAAAAEETARAPAPAEPSPRLDRLDPEHLSGFFELAFVPDELLSLCRELGVSPRGYRLEKLGPADHAALLADEYTAERKSRKTIEEAVARQLRTPALRTLWLTSVAARELPQLVAGDPVVSLARLAWRFAGDGDPAVREAATRAIDAGLQLLDQIAEQAAQQAPAHEAPAAPAAQEPAEPPVDVAELRNRAARAEHDREAARALLQQARAEIADRDRRLNEVKTELSTLRVETARQAAEISRLSATRSTDDRHLAHELRKVSAEKTRADERITELENELEEERRRRGEMAKELAARSERGEEAEGAAEVAESPDTRDFALPRFTDEFYKSLERWDRRIVKSAFEKALLLARDRRHPSLRAIALEGIENYFRIRVATDVRLIYRRAEDGSLELLSLIDREDLDRYIRQAKTRREDR